MTGFARVVTTASTLLLGISLSFGAAAQTLTTEQYRHPKTANDLKFNKTYLMGVADGLIAYNTLAERKFFCPPGLLPKISFDQANDLVMRYAHKASGASDLPLGRVLLFGLRQAYPCHR
jgi:hypothetical protein